MDSVELYRKLGGGEFDPGWTECGGIRLACTPERWEETRRQAGWAKTFGLPLELISPEEALERFPLMSTDKVIGASWLPTDGYLDPSQLTYAHGRRRAARRLPDPDQHARDRHRRQGRRGDRRADRARRHRVRGRGQRGRHVRGRDRPAGRRAHPDRADGARVRRHAAVPRARRPHRHDARPRPPRLLPRGGRRAGVGRLRAPQRAVGAARRGPRAGRDPARLQRPPARGGLGPLRGDRRPRAHARAGARRGQDHAPHQRPRGLHAGRRVLPGRDRGARLLRRRRLLRARAGRRRRHRQGDGRVDRRPASRSYDLWAMDVRRFGAHYRSPALHGQARARGLRDLLRHQVPQPRAPGRPPAARLARPTTGTARTAPRSARSPAGSA